MNIYVTYWKMTLKFVNFSHLEISDSIYIKPFNATKLQ